MELKIYGGFLALTHVITWYFWFQEGGVKNILSDPAPICWSFMNNCDFYREIPTFMWSVISVSYLMLSVATVALFFVSYRVRTTYILFLILTCLKFSLLLIDYRMMGNYHYMPFLVSLVYLLVPQKKEAILYTIVVFYVSAGLLKLDTEWLSGATLLEPFFIQGEVLEWILAYTIIFEVLIVPLTLSRSSFLFVFAFLQIIGFHITSWHIVGYFYPCVMFTILMAFPLFRIRRGGRSFVFKPEIYLKKTSILLIALLFGIQILPRILSPNLAVDSQGRLFTLNMLDARVQCEHFSYFKGKANSYVETSSERTDLGTRISCDPLVYLSEAQLLCDNKEVEEVPVYLLAKKSTHKDWLMVLHNSNYCDGKSKISWWGGL